MNSLDDAIQLIHQIHMECEGYEWDQTAWTLNDRLQERGITPSPAYVELLRRGENWFVIPLYWLGPVSAGALAAILEGERIDPWVLEYLLKSSGNVPAFAQVLSRRPGAPASLRFEAQWCVVEALKKLGPLADAAIPSLLEVLRDAETDSTLRGEVAVALGRITAEVELGYIGPATPAVVGALAEMLTQQTASADGCPFFCMMLLTALGDLGPASQSALPQVRAATTHENEDIRKDACETLKRIEASM